MPNDTKRKPRTNAKPYARKPGPKPKDASETAKGPKPKTSAKPIAPNARENLTLADWLVVYKYMDEHPNETQPRVVKYFATRKEGPLVFSQSALSRKLKKREEMEARTLENPNALSGKRSRIVTNPAVEKALVLWFKSMQEKGETVSGPMLVEKRARYEKQLDVPEEECLRGSGWVQSFCKAYGLREIRRHGEAGSVDQEAVARERERVSKILAEYEPRNVFNFDETGLYAFAPPDRGLATEQMSGKKKDKFRITIGFACNADGSEKEEAFFIGKSKNPRCFKKITPAKRGFYYRNNKSAWMTSELFEEWLKKLDIKMREQGRKIVLLVDNFSGHEVGYEPKNIRLEFFEPNMTSFVQPLDAGIIRCFKAIYRRAFCARAIDRDEAGDRDIFKIDLLEAMLMAKKAWSQVAKETIKNCWDHTKIQKNLQAGRSSNDTSNINGPRQHEEAWKILEDFATDLITMPIAEERLKALLGDAYQFALWKEAFDAVFSAENDTDAALAALDTLKKSTSATTTQPAAISNPQHPPTGSAAVVATRQLLSTQDDLMGKVEVLVKRRRIPASQRPTLEDLLNPVEEGEVGFSPYRFEGGDDEIVEVVKRALDGGDSDSDPEENDDEEDEANDLTLMQAIGLCEQMEKLCLAHGEDETGLELTQRVRKLRVQLRRKEIASQTQASLLNFAGWGSTTC